MEIKKFNTGVTCLGSVRLLPIDVGFDVRTTGDAVRPPVDPQDVGYEMRDGTPAVVSGSRDEIVAELIRNGYRIA